MCQIDTPHPYGHYPGMRSLSLALLLCLAGCSGDPSSLGITGPGTVELPKSRQEALPGGDIYPRDMQPNTGNGKYWGYNN